MLPFTENFLMDKKEKKKEGGGTFEKFSGLLNVIIIPLRPYLEKIKGCRRPIIFRIRP